MKNIFITLVLGISFSSMALAEQKPVDKAMAFGLGAGVSIPDAKNTQTRSAIEMSVLGKMGSELGFGFYYLNSAQQEKVANVPFDFNYALYGLQFTYHFDGEAFGAYFGARYGISKITVSTESYSPANLGFVFGYDHFLNNSVSIGGEGSWMSVQKKDTLDSFSAINVLLGLKFWL